MMGDRRMYPEPIASGVPPSAARFGPGLEAESRIQRG